MGSVTRDGNEAVAKVAYLVNEVIAIYPITPASPMGEWADQWAAEGRPNLWGSVPRVQEMQAEGGAAGAVHGALQAGSLTTTFTASQGLLLMIPNMYKIAGELTSTVIHIAARSVAAQALSIFGDHSDVMAARATGFAQLFANSVQEAMDFALIAQAATLKARVPFLHVMDGFRTSHELATIEDLDPDTIAKMLDSEAIRAHRERALSPDHPFIRGTAQNPDVFFQARESVNPYYQATPGIVQAALDQFAELTGRHYRLFDYVGHPEAERVLVLMGSACDTAEEAVQALVARGEQVGLVKVRLFRPFSVEHLVAALPRTTRAVAVLDRTKEPGSAGEPLYQDVVTALVEGWEGRLPTIIGGRYGLSSKEFTPAMAAAILSELQKDRPKRHFTIGIIDDLTHSHLDYDPNFITECSQTVRALFWGLGSDGTVGANKNTVKIIGEETPSFAQGYFVYDSKKAGARTVSHLRFGPKPIASPYLIQKASFVAVHQFEFLRRFPVLERIEPRATLLLNSPFSPELTWSKIPAQVQAQIRDLELEVWAIDAYQVARSLGLGVRINTIMQTCFFAISKVLPKEQALARIKTAIEKSYGKGGRSLVERNFKAVDSALDGLYRLEVGACDGPPTPDPVPAQAPEFVREVTARILAEQGDLLPVSALPVDGTYPSATTRWEKRNLSLDVPVWEPDLCIQCGKCVMVCPHSVIRAKAYPAERLETAPPTFKSDPCRWKEMKELRYTLQVSVEDCTGCRLCVEACPAKDKSNLSRKAINMAAQHDLRDAERANWEFFLELDDHPPADLSYHTVKDVQLLQPRFEFSGACAGCGETPYLKLLSQLFGDRAIIANATGCSSIYGGNLPTTPWATDKNGRGPAWSNSLFEDNAEFGLGMRLALDHQRAYALRLVAELAGEIGENLARDLMGYVKDAEAQRARVAQLKERLNDSQEPRARDLLALADGLVPRSLWIVGGDGWAYDIGYGGLDHVLASAQNVNVLVLDTEVYSNTGGQASKATPLGAVAKFTAAGKPTPKKDLGRLAMSHGNVYVAQVAMGASDTQTLRAFREAESYDGPSLIIAYSQCIAHGIDMAKGMNQQNLAVKTGQWLLYRYDPRRVMQGLNPLLLDSKEPSAPLRTYLDNEGRFRILHHTNPEAAEEFALDAQEMVQERYRHYQALAGMEN